MPNANRIWSTAPTIRCPMCDHEWKRQSTVDTLIPGALCKCPKCGRMIECVGVLHTWEWQCIEPEGGELQTGPIDKHGDFGAGYEEKK